MFYLLLLLLFIIIIALKMFYFLLPLAVVVVVVVVVNKKSKFNDINEKFIFEINDFLTNEECDRYISENKELNKSTLLSDEKIDNVVRSSSDTVLYDKILDEKILSLVNKYSKIKLNLKNGEESTLINYKKKEEYKPHYDICHPTQSDESHLKHCKEDYNRFTSIRYLSVIIYLNDNYEGGETHFPRLNLNIKPKRGKALVFLNCNKSINLNNGLCDIIKDSEHGGNPIKNGEKWIIVKWYRLKEIN